jgi:hypothetical protein
MIAICNVSELPSLVEIASGKMLSLLKTGRQPVGSQCLGLLPVMKGMQLLNYPRSEKVLDCLFPSAFDAVADEGADPATSADII